jgi:hypothetical protein
MKSYLKITLVILLAACFSSCFEIREEVNMKADGSGEVIWVANFSQSKDNVRRYLTMDVVEGYKVPKPHEIESFLNHIKVTLGNVEGISGVFTKADWSSYIFTVSARFSNVRTLNKAIITMSKHLDYVTLEPVEKANFSFENERFARLFDYPGKPKEFQELPSMQRYMLEKARMISIYRFEKNITEFTNKKAQISPSGKAIMLQVPVADLAKGTGTLENTIKF